MAIKKMILIVMWILIVVPFLISAQEKLSGIQIIQKVYDRPTGKDQDGELVMTLINARGDQRVRKIKQFVKEFDTMEKKIMFFTSPADVNNTSFMNWSYDKESKDDDQWIYLPALKKVKRISSDSKSDYFMGSDFTYDDLGDRHPLSDKHKLLREENFNGEDCYVVESTPKEDDYMYFRTVTWIVKGKWVGQKKEFYDEDNEYLKTLSVKKYEKIKGYWIILVSEMYNVQKKHTTRMELSNVKLDTGISASNFSERMMMRGL